MILIIRNTANVIKQAGIYRQLKNVIQVILNNTKAVFLFELLDVLYQSGVCSEQTVVAEVVEADDGFRDSISQVGTVAEVFLLVVIAFLLVEVLSNLEPVDNDLFPVDAVVLIVVVSASVDSRAAVAITLTRASII